MCRSPVTTVQPRPSLHEYLRLQSAISVRLPAHGVPVFFHGGFGSRQLLQRGSSVTGTNVGATREVYEPLLDGADAAAGVSVWYYFAPAVTGSYFITAAGSNFDTVLGVYAVGSAAGFAGLTNVSVQSSGAVPRLLYPWSTWGRG